MCKHVLLLLMVFLSSAAYAGFVQVDIGTDFPPGQGIPDFVRSHLVTIFPDGQPGQGNALLEISEVLKKNTDATFKVFGSTDEDPVMHIKKEIENSSGMVWIGYNVTLSGSGVNFVANSATSDKFTVASQDNFNIVYTQPQQIWPGQFVTIEFDINVATLGDFGFTLTQSPDMVEVPEPFTVALLGLGSLVFLSRRK